MAIANATLRYQAGNAKLESYLAWDDSSNKPRPGVLIVHEWWGLDDYVKGRANQLAQMGFTAMAVDMYGGGKQAANPDEAGKAMNAVLGDMDNGTKRLATSLAILKSQKLVDAKKTAAIGYCFGGAMVLHMARSGMDVGGVASFHGSLGSFVEPKPDSVRAKVLVCHGAEDKLVPDDDIKAFRTQMDKAGASYEFVSYPGALHGFSNPEATGRGKQYGLPLAYDEKTDKASWAKMKGMFDSIFR